MWIILYCFSCHSTTAATLCQVTVCTSCWHQLWVHHWNVLVNGCKWLPYFVCRCTHLSCSIDYTDIVPCQWSRDDVRGGAPPRDSTEARQKGAFLPPQCLLYNGCFSLLCLLFFFSLICSFLLLCSFSHFSVLFYALMSSYSKLCFFAVSFAAFLKRRFLFLWPLDIGLELLVTVLLLTIMLGLMLLCCVLTKRKGRIFFYFSNVGICTVFTVVCMLFKLHTVLYRTRTIVLNICYCSLFVNFALTGNCIFVFVFLQKLPMLTLRFICIWILYFGFTNFLHSSILSFWIDFILRAWTYKSTHLFAICLIS